LLQNIENIDVVYGDKGYDSNTLCIPLFLREGVEKNTYPAQRAKVEERNVIINRK